MPSLSARLVALCAGLSLACSGDSRPKPPASGQGAGAARAPVAPPLPSATISLTVSGAARFDGPLDERATCTFSESNGQQVLQVEGFGRNAQLNFTILSPREGTFPISLGAVSRHGATRVTGVQVAVNGQSYVGGGGSATITDPLGRRGSFNAKSFTKIGVKKHAKRGANLAAHAEWSCE